MQNGADHVQTGITGPQSCCFSRSWTSEGVCRASIPSVCVLGSSSINREYADRWSVTRQGPFCFCNFFNFFLNLFLHLDAWGCTNSPKHHLNQCSYWPTCHPQSIWIRQRLKNAALIQPNFSENNNPINVDLKGGALFQLIILASILLTVLMLMLIHFFNCSIRSLLKRRNKTNIERKFTRDMLELQEKIRGKG